MTENEALEFIYSRRKFAKSNSFERMEALLSELGNPHKDLSFVHVAGTNGKGSVCTMISSVLISSGCKTGLFTSPFVICFRERIQINGKFIPEKRFCQITEEVKAASDRLSVKGLTPTFFETVLAMALLYYKEEGCDIVILEAGIGGRDDSTNIIPSALVSVITSVSYDHTDVLGDTITSIAKHKSGIIKENSACVSFPEENGSCNFVPQQKETVQILRDTCERKNANFIMPDIKSITDIEKGSHSTSFLFEGKKINMSFTGDHQLGNALTALSALKVLQKKGFDITDKSIKEGFENAFIPGRLEVVSENPLVIIDGGHNEGCITALKNYIEENLKDKSITALLGFMKDKDYESAIKIIAPCCKSIVFTRADDLRGESAENLSVCARKLCSSIYAENDRKKSFRKAMSLLPEDGALLCAGSFYLISEIREYFY